MRTNRFTRPTTISLFILTILIILPAAFVGIGAQIDYDEIEPALARILNAPETTVKRYNFRKMQYNQIAIQVNRRHLALQSKNTHNYGLLSRNRILRIDYITARCANDTTERLAKEDRFRVERIFRFRRNLFKRGIPVQRIVQTDCTNSYETSTWFYGFVMTVGVVGIGNFRNERMEFAKANEFTEGDFKLTMAAWNDPAAPKPPTKFRKGHVRPYTDPRNPKSKTPGKLHNVKKFKGGKKMEFQRGGPLPTPTICGDKLFVSGGFNSSSYHAYTAKDLKHIWSASMSDNGPSTAACGPDDESLIFNTESCTIFALDGETGKHIWSHWLGDPLAASPSSADNIIITSYPAGYPGAAPTKDKPNPTHVLAALNAKTGEFIWQKWIDSEVISAPVIAEGTVYISTMSGIVYEFNLAEGETKSARRLRSSSTPLYVDSDKLFITKRVENKGNPIFEAPAFLSENLKLANLSQGFRAPHIDRAVQEKSQYAKNALSYDAANGFGAGAPYAAHSEVSFINLGLKTVSGMQLYEGARPALVDDTYVMTMGDQVVAYEGENTTPKWKLKLPGDLKKSGGSLGSSPAAAGDFVFVSTHSGQVLQINSSDGTVAQKYNAGVALRSQPLIHEGKIYAPTTQGGLFVFETGNKDLTGWSAWGGNSARSGQAD